jgi:hypothetical protein
LPWLSVAGGTSSADESVAVKTCMRADDGDDDDDVVEAFAPPPWPMPIWAHPAMPVATAKASAE